MPRLELMAAILGLRLTESVSRVYSGGLSQAVFWSDSMNVLWWIRGRSRIFKPFVPNRVGEIQSLTNPKQWRFVPTNENPVDFTTRGMRVSDMVKEKKWWSGPDFLQKEETDWPVNQTDTDKVSETTENKKAAQGSTQAGRSNGDWTVISVHEDDQPWRLDPRCFSNWTKQSCGGTNQLLAALSTCFWIISGHEEIREWEKECNECQRRKAKAAKQIMAPLPQIRLRFSLRAFAQTAVDYGGQFITVQGRRTHRQKRYLCLFTCLATRAVHLEMAYALDTNSFLNAFYRMVNRRGLPREMLSDNGGNFVGGNKELSDLVKELVHRKPRNQMEV
ncbi:uncharacterized protein [Montipora foliosa]|uniref:uncharacterized protein n=1 Tax=Montipora foliosa TaxID=591990 RepID=UPI0035F16CD6